MNRFLRIFLGGLFYVAVGMPGSAAEPEGKPGEDFEKVRQAPMFAIGGIGIAGRRTEAEVALETILKQPDAAGQCRKLLKDGTVAGRLYGLFGLKRVDPEGFKEVIPVFRKSEESVQTASGCIMMSAKAATLAKGIEDGMYEAPSE